MGHARGLTPKGHAPAEEAGLSFAVGSWCGDLGNASPGRAATGGCRGKRLPSLSPEQARQHRGVRRAATEPSKASDQWRLLRDGVMKSALECFQHAAKCEEQAKQAISDAAARCCSKPPITGVALANRRRPKRRVAAGLRRCPADGAGTRAARCRVQPDAGDVRIGWQRAAAWHPRPSSTFVCIQQRRRLPS